MHNNQLIQLLENRDQSGFEYLYNKYADALYGYITRVISDRTAAEQLLKESFIKIWQECPGFDLSQFNLFSCMLRVTTGLLVEYATQKGENRKETLQKIIRANGAPIYATAS
jgi:RNA polymerase sigma-70 factor (ECF subfamily)